MTPHTTAYGYPALLINKGVCGTRFAQTVLDENSFIDCVARRGARGYKTPKPTTVIPAQAGIRFKRGISPLSPTPLPPTGEGLTRLAGFDLKSPAAAPVMI